MPVKNSMNITVMDYLALVKKRYVADIWAMLGVQNSVFVIGSVNLIKAHVYVL